MHTMRKHLREGSLVVADEWLATPAAVQGAGSQMMGTVKHSQCWRNPRTGVHSNDIESEFARFNRDGCVPCRVMPCDVCLLWSPAFPCRVF